MDDIKKAAAAFDKLLLATDHDAHASLPQLRGLSATICKLLRVGKFAEKVETDK